MAYLPVLDSRAGSFSFCSILLRLSEQGERKTVAGSSCESEKQAPDVAAVQATAPSCFVKGVARNRWSPSSEIRQWAWPRWRNQVSMDRVLFVVAIRLGCSGAQGLNASIPSRSRTHPLRGWHSGRSIGQLTRESSTRSLLRRSIAGPLATEGVVL